MNERHALHAKQPRGASIVIMSSAEHLLRAHTGSSGVDIFTHLMLRKALGQVLMENEGTTQEMESPAFG